MFTYLVLKNLPPVPQHFVDIAHDLRKSIDLEELDLGWKSEKTSDDDCYKNRKLLIDGKEEPTTYQRRKDIGQEFDNWVHKNIHPQGRSCGVSLTDGRLGRHQGPHTDLKRNFALIYLLDSGGPDTATCFYKENGHPIVRSDRQAVCNDYSRLQLIERAQFPIAKWVILNVMILHGVENIETIRTSFQVSIADNVWFD